MRKKVLLFPGFAEDSRVFDKISPFLLEDFELVEIDFQPILAEMPKGKGNLPLFCKKVAEKYEIQATDILVGHSFGGWVAVNIQAITGSPVVSIASFTNPRKPVHRPIGFHRLGFMFVRLGLFKLGLFHFFARHKYRNLAEFPIIQLCLEIMKTWKDEDLLKVMRLIAGQTEQLPSGAFLRYHGIKDEIVYPPDEPYICIPNARHAIHYTHAEWMANGIKRWIKMGFPDL